MNKEMMRNAGFSKQVNAVENNICPFCKKKIDMKNFKDALSIKEYKISGLCQQCQDEIFE